MLWYTIVYLANAYAYGFDIMTAPGKFRPTDTCRARIGRCRPEEDS